MFHSLDSGHRPDPYEIVKLRLYIQKTLRQATQKTKWPKIKNVLGSSGTLRAIKKIIRRHGRKDDPFRLEDLSSLVEWMSVMTRKELSLIPGMEPQRVEQILAGAILMEEIMRFQKVKRAFHTEYSLRDGMFLEAVDMLFGK